jgi:hypothetical protein
VRRRWLFTVPLLLAGLAFAYRPIFSGQVIAGRDAFRLFIPYAALTLESFEHGELPLWNPYMRLGQPMAATLISQGLYPPAALTALAAGPVYGLTLRQVLHALIAWLGVYWLARRLRQGHWAAALGASAFALSPMLTDLGGHQNVVDAAAWTGWMAAAWLDTATRATARSAALAGLFTALSFLAGSPETLLWQLVLCAALGIAHRPSRGAAGPLALGAATSLGLSAFLLLPAAELVLHSSRGSGRTDQLDWSTSFAQLAALGWPLADHPRGAYWDGPDQWWMVTVFLGTGTCALAACGLRRSRRVVPFAACAGLFALVALGSSFPASAALWRIPPLELFRFPAKYLLAVAFCLAVLAGQGLDRAVVLARKLRLRRGLRPTLAAVGGGLALLLLGALLLQAPVLRPGVRLGLPWVTAVLLAGALALIWAPRAHRRAALAAVVLLELAIFHATQVGFGWERPARLAEPSALARALPPGFRGRVSLPVTDDLVPASEVGFIDRSRDALVPNRHLEERLRALEGYGAIEPERTDEFHMAGNRSVFDLAGVEYYLRRKPAPFPDLEVVARPDGLPALYRSRTAAPRAFVVHRAEVTTDPEALARVLSPDQPWRTAAFLAEGEPLDGPACEGSRATLARETPSALAFDVEACARGYLVVTDSHYPGWRARVDGEEAPLRRANYTLRAVPVPAGAHRVELEYRPLSFAAGAWISIATLAGWATALGWALLIARASPRRRRG